MEGRDVAAGHLGGEDAEVAHGDFEPYRDGDTLGILPDLESAAALEVNDDAGVGCCAWPPV